MIINLNEIENKYSDAIQSALANTSLTPSLLVDLSVDLYKKHKIDGISDGAFKANDMLLYQYGVYDWGDENGRHFEIDITRQFMKPSEYEPYQLHFVLVFPPEPFEGVGAYETWGDMYDNIDSFVSHIKSTNGFKTAMKNIPLTYKLWFSQC